MSEHYSTRRVRFVSLFIIFLLCSIIYSPKVLAESKWEEDGWLKTTLAQERLNNGDEFGCYGMQGLSWQSDPGAVALECREYIEDRLIANKWGENPISTFTPDSLSQTQHEQISKQGFMVHGDNTGTESSAWHSASDKPLDMWDWYNIGRRGGSLEQIIGSKEQVEAAVNEGGLVNLYWIGRVNEATIRHDSEIEDYISEEADAWLTTWGQTWSYWATTRCYQIDHTISPSGDNYVFSFESLITEECTNLIPERWNVPVTWIIDINQAEVLSVIPESGVIENITGDRHTKQGYTHVQGQYLHLTVINGNRVEITINESEYDILGISEFWNNHSAAITIASHETTDLFKWSKRFVDQDDLIFTWLVQPRPVDGASNWIPYVAFSVGVGVVLTMLVVLKREGLGPLAKKED